MLVFTDIKNHTAAQQHIYNKDYIHDIHEPLVCIRVLRYICCTRLNISIQLQRSSDDDRKSIDIFNAIYLYVILSHLINSKMESFKGGWCC